MKMVEGIRIISPEEQLQDINAVNTLDEYRTLHLKYLKSPYGYLTIASSEAKSLLSGDNSEQLRLISLVTTQVSQAGFESQLGHLRRHNSNKWRKSVIDPKHQLAAASYLGSINTQAYEIRKGWENTVKDDVSRDRMLALWGMFMSVSNGVVRDERELPAHMLKQWIDIRMGFTQPPISLPNKELNAALAELSFSGDQAENMANEQFMDAIYLKAQKALAGIVDLSKINFGENIDIIRS